MQLSSRPQAYNSKVNYHTLKKKEACKKFYLKAGFPKKDESSPPLLFKINLGQAKFLSETFIYSIYIGNIGDVYGTSHDRYFK